MKNRLKELRLIEIKKALIATGFALAIGLGVAAAFERVKGNAQ